MDFSKFSDPNFAAKEWVNTALKTQKEAQPPGDLSAHASTLVMKLQLFIQEVNNALEETSVQMVQNLPRVLRDVEAVRQEASLLKDQMQIVKDDIKRVESDTSQSMQRLVELDAIKTRMLQSQNALQEADNWTTLSADVEEVFASQNIQMIAEKVAGMQQSLNVLHDVPDFEERRKLLESLKNRLEALISPKLIAAFNTHSLDEAQEYVEIFSNIERDSQLLNYYIGCHRSGILQLWSSLYSADQKLSECLSPFYDELLAKWHTEYVWCSQVFPDPLKMLAVLFSQTVSSLDPPLARCLQAAVRGDAGGGAERQQLPTLLQLRAAALRFIKGLERAVGSTKASAEVFSLVEAVHTPYCQLLVQYPALEGQLLRQQLHHLELSSLGGFEDNVALISASVPKVFTIASEALQRCLQLTEGWGVHGLLTAVELLLSQYLSKISSSVHQLRRACGIEGPAGGGTSQTEEWSRLQPSFRLIQCCGEILQRLDALVSQLCSVVLSHAPNFKTPASDSAPFGCYDYLSVYHPEEHTAVMEMLAAIEKDGIEAPLLSPLTNQVHSLNEQSHSLTFDLLFAPLKEKLSNIPQLKVWLGGVQSPLDSPRGFTDDLPAFSLSPLAYITEIGDYLLTLPQQLEPFTSQDNPALLHAFQHGRLPFPDPDSPFFLSGGGGGSREGGGGGGGEERHPSDDWLGAIARGTMETYVQCILEIPSLPPAAAEQLATDIAYLCNVLAALGQNPSTQLTQLELLVKADREHFVCYDGDASISQTLYRSIAKLRSWH